MRFSRLDTAGSFVFLGGATFALGLALGLIKLLMMLAWYAWAVICMAGLVLMLLGTVFSRRRRRRSNEIEDRIHYV